MSKPTFWIGNLLWLDAGAAFAVVRHITTDGGSWWWWAPAVALAVAHSALLDWYVRESYRAALLEQMEG